MIALVDVFAEFWRLGIPIGKNEAWIKSWTDWGVHGRPIFRQTPNLSTTRTWGGFVSPWTQCGNHPAVHGFPEVIEDHYSHSLDQDRTIVGSSKIRFHWTCFNSILLTSTMIFGNPSNAIEHDHQIPIRKVFPAGNQSVRRRCFWLCIRLGRQWTRPSWPLTQTAVTTWPSPLV